MKEDVIIYRQQISEMKEQEDLHIEREQQYIRRIEYLENLLDEYAQQLGKNMTT